MQFLHKHAFSILLILALAGYGTWMATNIQAVAGGSDSSGYMNNARLLERMELKIKRREIDGLSPQELPIYSYIPLGFVPVGEHEMVPTYPMGFPLLILGMSHFTSWDHAAAATLVVHALLSLVVLCGLSILLGLSRPLSLLAALLLGLSYVFVDLSMQTMSDVPALAWCSLAFLAAVLSNRNAAWALLAGAAIAMAVLIRPSNVLMVPPLAIVFGFSWKRWLLFGLGGLPGAAFQWIINWRLYGNGFASGYGDVGTLFRAQYLSWSLAAYARWLPVALTPALVLAFGTPFFPTLRKDRILIALAVWALAYLGFYAFYFHTSENWTYMRFILPAFSAMIILVMLVAQRIGLGMQPARRRAAGAMLVLLVVGWNAYWIAHFGVWSRNEGRYQAAAQWTAQNLPPNAVVLAMQVSGSLLYYTPFTFVRYEQFDRDSFAQVEQACDAAGRPIYAMLFPFETDAVLRMPGTWTRIGSVAEIVIWRRERS